MYLEYKTRFDVGDTLWYVGPDAHHRVVCPVCEGNGQYTHNNIELQCGYCGTKGHVLDPQREPIEVVVQAVRVYTIVDEVGEQNQEKYTVKPVMPDKAIGYVGTLVVDEQHLRKNIFSIVGRNSEPS